MKLDVFNVRVLVLRAFPIYRESNNDHNNFKDNVTDANLLTGIYNMTGIIEDEAYELASSLWCKVYESTTNCQESLLSFVGTWNWKYLVHMQNASPS